MRSAALPAALAATFLLAGGCRPAERAVEHSESGTPAATPAATATPAVVTIHARDYAFEGPDTLSAGMTTFHLVNDGPGLHHVVVVRLDSAKTVADLGNALKKPGPWPHWAVLVGGPNAVDPKSDANATLPLTAGNYALLCFVDVPGGVPHFAKGMMHPVTVTGSPSAAAAPTADVVITLADYRFGLAAPLTAGHHTFEVQNHATQPHELELVRLAPGKTVKDMLDWIEHPNGPPPGNALGGTAPAIPGAPVYFTADVTPGQYALICFVPDAKDGKPHFMHGMVQSLTVS
jgi:uncharacterized cupredoxin-like copper-binding protein